MTFDFEKTFREVMGMNPSQPNTVVGRITPLSQGSRASSDFDCRKKLDDAKDILQHIRNNWDKEDFDAEETDRKIDALLERFR